MIAPMHDYLTTAVPDYAVVLSLKPQKVLVEDGQKNMVMHTMDDGSDVVIDLSGGYASFIVELQWSVITDADAGLLFDTYHNPAKANQMGKTFAWAHPTDGYTYVARFVSKLPRALKPGVIRSIEGVRLKITGNV